MKKISALASAFFFILIILSTIVHAEDWIYFLETDEGGKYYIDLDSIHHSAQDRIRVRKKFEPSESSGMAYVITSLEIDCSQKKTRTLSEKRKTSLGRITEASAQSKWIGSRGDDVNETLIELTCSLQKK
jgi:hypothetical protein